MFCQRPRSNMAEKFEFCYVNILANVVKIQYSITQSTTFLSIEIKVPFRLIISAGAVIQLNDEVKEPILQLVAIFIEDCKRMYCRQWECPPPAYCPSLDTCIIGSLFPHYMLRLPE